MLRQQDCTAAQLQSSCSSTGLRDGGTRRQQKRSRSTCVSYVLLTCPCWHSTEARTHVLKVRPTTPATRQRRVSVSCWGARWSTLEAPLAPTCGAVVRGIARRAALRLPQLRLLQAVQQLDQQLVGVLLAPKGHQPCYLRAPKWQAHYMCSWQPG